MHVYVIAIQINRHFKVRQVSIVDANIADSVFASESFKFAQIFLQTVNKVLSFFHGNLALLKATNKATCLPSNQGAVAEINRDCPIMASQSFWLFNGQDINLFDIGCQDTKHRIDATTRKAVL